MMQIGKLKIFYDYGKGSDECRVVLVKQIGSGHEIVDEGEIKNTYENPELLEGKE